MLIMPPYPDFLVCISGNSGNIFPLFKQLQKVYLIRVEKLEPPTIFSPIFGDVRRSRPLKTVKILPVSADQGRETFGVYTDDWRGFLDVVRKQNIYMNEPTQPNG